jgi:hypothetical protein
MEDMRTHRLTCGPQETMQLCGLAVQALLGDFDPSVHKPGCVDPLAYRLRLRFESLGSRGLTKSRICPHSSVHLINPSDCGRLLSRDPPSPVNSAQPHHISAQNHTCKCVRTTYGGGLVHTHTPTLTLTNVHFNPKVYTRQW